MAVDHTIRTPSGEPKHVTLTRGLAIKAFCTECMGWTGTPKDCPAPLCPLYPFRGKTLLAYDKTPEGGGE